MLLTFYCLKKILQVKFWSNLQVQSWLYITCLRSPEYKKLCNVNYKTNVPSLLDLCKVKNIKWLRI